MNIYSFGGQSAPPSLKDPQPSSWERIENFRGAVRPPFIEGQTGCRCRRLLWLFRGAVRPPFIEGSHLWLPSTDSESFGGQSAPPSLKEERTKNARLGDALSGGSPPPLH